MISQRERGELARFYTVTDPNKHKKGYTVYKVTARIISRKNPEDVQEITVWKRYSDFRKLHHDLWQLHKNLFSQSELFPPFAKAKVFGRFDETVIEERRQCSEDLLQFSANIPALYSSQHIQDFFKGGEVSDGSELIGPAEPFLDFLADSLSDCSSEVQRDIGGADDLTITSQSEYGGPSSDSDLTSLAVDIDSLAELDDGMASGRSSPNQPLGGSSTITSTHSSPSLPPLYDYQQHHHQQHTSNPAPGSPAPEVSRASRTALFPSSLRRGNANARETKRDYLDRASEHIRLAVQKEAEQDYQSAFSYYRSGVDLLLQGVQGEPSPTRREAVKRKTAEYLMRAEQISNQHLRSSMGQGSTQTVAMGAQCSTAACRGGQQSPAEELRAYRVLGVIDKVLLVMDKRTQETFILKGLRKSSDCGRPKRTIMPHSVPHMVRLRKFIVSEDTVFLLLQYAEGGKLWSHIGKFLRNSSPEESFDIPFIQKSHTTAVHSAQHAAPKLGLDSDSSGSGPGCVLQRQGESSLVLPQKSALHPGLADSLGPQLDSVVTSELEECTNSYLNLCNEYEQEKVEPEALGEEEEKEGEGGVLRGQEASSLDVTVTTTTTSSRTRSLLSNDSLCSPISAQELRFFTETAGDHNNGHCQDIGQDHGEVFSPLLSPAVPLSLDQSKRTPMEFFRIDSKDSASEVTWCPDSAELRPKPDPSKPIPFLSTSDLGSEVTDLSDLVEEVKGHRGGSDLWGLDGSDQGSNESVPVISFKEAVVEDEGRPPDLLVNLPGVMAGGVEGVVGVSGEVEALEKELVSLGVCLALEAKASPNFTQPDVLQLHHELEEGEELAVGRALPSGDRHATSSSPCASLWDDCGLAFGQDAKIDKMASGAPVLPNKDFRPASAVSIAPLSSSNTDIPFADSLRSLPERLEAILNLQVHPDSLVLNPDGTIAGSNRGQDGTGASSGAESALGVESQFQASKAGVEDMVESDKDVSRLFAELDQLSAVASQARIPEEFVRCWAVDMVSALDSLHQEGIVCKDLNPNNILINSKGHVELTYFCSWSDVEDSYDREAITNMYCAPEVGGISEETAACDWWSLGAILFELLIGKSLLQCHPAGISRHTALNVPEFVSEEAMSLLVQLLQFNPIERLGAGVAGAEDIKSHPFFGRVDWPK
ncbi:ribosomal protein S6 kinase delta-1 isoform X1 [Coregonus clupeaformis]|uniref:ribosomal protein S6 kinase delta-1 isoform X1 n=1 Tax=Coregonus clupeaformis TaxID=59861 RepID=UPI001E1C5008|nr:ribosomal protein S6 kinase delta-1 isoform X1 [Coregonus clupeaformis]